MTRAVDSESQETRLVAVQEILAIQIQRTLLVKIWLDILLTTKDEFV